jgi:hypothetical protein
MQHFKSPIDYDLVISEDRMISWRQSVKEQQQKCETISMKIFQWGGSTMQDLFPLLLAALFVYLLFFRKGGMGMGCCGGHGSHNRHDDHGGHGHGFDKDRHFNELSEDRKEGIIDLPKDQYTVMSVEEDKQPKTIHRTGA